MSRFRRGLKTVSGSAAQSAQKRGNPKPKVRQPKVLDKTCYWLICIPVLPDNHGWQWKGIVWVKGKDHEMTHMFKPTIADIEAAAAQFMRCEDGPG